MAKSTLTSDETDIKLLRAAAKKIRYCAIPHVISEDRWTARHSNDVKGIVYYERPVYDLIGNVKSAISWFHEKESSFSSIIWRREKKQSFLDRQMQNLRLAKISLTRMERNLPDAEVDGNIVHWMEHAIHIALWSPVVTEAVAVFLEAEADSREQGITSPSSASAVALAKAIKKKKTWDNTIQNVVPKQTLVASLTNLIPSRRAEAIRRLKYMRTHEADYDVSRALYEAYGHQTAPVARKNAERMLRRAEKAAASPSIKSAADRRVWEGRAAACRIFIASLESDDTGNASV